ncbi:MAG: hypothetical protein HY046_07850 [Acidobacteria bacterium]|nr:hypothetical protein [Acidobacteriota bacterium]
MKRGMKLLLCAMVAAGPMGMSASAQTAPAMPTVDQVIEKYVTALGGKAAMEKINSRVAKGTFEAPEQGATGTVEFITKAPDKLSVNIDVDGFGLVRQAFNGTIGWDDNPQAGFRELSGSELAGRKRGADFYGALHFKQTYTKLTLTGKGKSGTKDAFVVEADPGDGKLTKFYFDVTSGLLLQSSTERDSPAGGTVTVDTILDDYRDVEGVKVPFLRKQISPVFSSTIKFTEIKVNVAVDDARFDKPKN